MISSVMDAETIIYMALITGSLLAGLVFGLLRKKLTAREKKGVSLAITGLVFVLIFLMGLKTGLNKGVMDNLGTYGLNALLLALGAIAGSLVFVVIFDRLFLRGVPK
ncbi:MAG: LysO family transporter [Methanocella sp.]